MIATLYSKTKTQAEISHIWDTNFISLLYFSLQLSIVYPIDLQ